jgi:hypothetical protein
MATPDRELIDQLLAQNDLLIKALVANQPVEVIKALNPPIQQLPAPRPDDYLSADTEHRDPFADDWADPDITSEELMVKWGPQKVDAEMEKMENSEEAP